MDGSRGTLKATAATGRFCTGGEFSPGRAQAPARVAVKEMHRQVGDLVMHQRGIAQRGILLRHLVMPGQLDETRAILRWIAEELSPDTYVNLMDQNRPTGKVSRTRYTELNRSLTSVEYRGAVEFAEGLGLRLDERRGVV